MQRLTDNAAVAGAGLASITAATAPWWVPVVIQLVGLLITYLEGERKGKRKAAQKQAAASEGAKMIPDSEK